jgi:hypothetical protein
MSETPSLFSTSNNPQREPQRIAEEAFGSLGGSPAPISPYRHRRLPPELIDSVIDALHDDPAALMICALVCRSWVHASRHHLFSYLAVFPETRSDLVALLSSASCTIGPAVRDLRLTLRTINDLHEIINNCRLPHVTHLTLAKLALSESQAFASLATISFLQHLESLRLSCVKFDNPNMFFSLLFHCIRLRSLDWQDLSFQTPISGPDLRSLPFDWDALTPELTALAIPHDCDDILHWMMACWGSKIPRLTKISLHFHSPSTSLHVLKRLLEAVGPSLRVLDSWRSRRIREWSHTCIHQWFAYSSYSTQRK